LKKFEYFYSKGKKMAEKFEPRIVGFLCNWCSYAGADLAGTSKLKVPASLTPIRVMCSSRVDPVLVETAFLQGADGVLVAGCHPGDCHYDEGNYYARRRFAVLKKVVESLGLESDRLRLSWISASEGQRFADVVNEFNKKIKKMGPSPIKGKKSL
jgi:F420-non-reducing hydrogenase iron-sulfur subunit